MERTVVAYGDENSNMLVNVSVIWCRVASWMPMALVVVLAAGHSVVSCASHRPYSAMLSFPKATQCCRNM